MNHLETYQYELHVPTSEREWLQWAANAESLLGHSLDGNNAENGFSLGYAYDWFMAGRTAEDYVKGVKAKETYTPVDRP